MNITNNKDCKFLYKFLPFNQFSLQIFINKQLWLGSPDFLNDPFEGDFIINNYKDFRNEDTFNLLIETVNKGKYKNYFNQSFRNAFEENEITFLNAIYVYLNNSIRNNFGTTSFSKKCNLIKMWSHYADSHKGFVIVFDKDKLDHFISKPEPELFDFIKRERGITIKSIRKTRLVDIEYGILSAVELIKKDGIISIKDDKNLLTKKLPTWKTEHEVRIIKQDDFLDNCQRLLKFDLNCISGIILGQQILPENISTIKNLIIQNNMDVSLYQAKKSQTRNKIIFEKCK